MGLSDVDFREDLLGVASRMRVTLRDIVESIQGLRDVARDLTATADSGTPQGAPEGTVLAAAKKLASDAAYLRSVAEELLTLVPERKVAVPPDPPEAPPS